MKNTATLVLLSLFLSISLVAADWNILGLFNGDKDVKTLKLITEEESVERPCPDDCDVVVNLKQYYNAWKLNVELHNIRDFEVVPSELTSYIGDYMNSEQYKVDIHLAAEQVYDFLTRSFRLNDDGKDAWIFDIDEVLLSTVPYYSKYQYGGIKVNKTHFENWLAKGQAPALCGMTRLFHLIRARGLKVFILSSRPEYLRAPTINNLIDVGYHGWTELILRSPYDNYGTAEKYKAEQRTKLVQQGYRLWGIVGSQWSALGGYTNARRTFKLPNPMYYES